MNLPAEQAIRACHMLEADVIQPAHLLALSLMALGVTTLHGVRSSGPSTPGAPRAVRAPGAQPGAGTLPRERTCAPTRERGSDVECASGQ